MRHNRYQSQTNPVMPAPDPKCPPSMDGHLSIITRAHAFWCVSCPPPTHLTPSRSPKKFWTPTFLAVASPEGGFPTRFHPRDPSVRPPTFHPLSFRWVFFVFLHPHSLFHSALLTPQPLPVVDNISCMNWPVNVLSDVCQQCNKISLKKTTFKQIKTKKRKIKIKKTYVQAAC